MRQAQTRFSVATDGQGLVEITDDVTHWCAGQAIQSGLLTLFCQHTSASLTIQENADPAVIADLQSFFATLAPQQAGRYRHSQEGPDDMPAHIRSALTDVSLSIPVADGRPVLGTWQGIYLFEHRTAAHLRHVAAHLSGV